MVKKIKRKKPVRKWVKHLKRYFSKEETQMANRYIKKKGNSTSLLSRKCKYKTTVWYYLITAGMVSIKGQKIPSTSKDVEKLHCDPKNHSTTGLPVHHKLPESTQTHAHQVSDAIHLILCHPLLLLPPMPPSIRVFSNESTLRVRWPKDWNFSFNISPSNEHPGLICFRTDWLDLLAVQGTLKSLL